VPVGSHNAASLAVHILAVVWHRKTITRRRRGSSSSVNQQQWKSQAKLFQFGAIAGHGTTQKNVPT
jgi:hypothetical protein